jgi:cytochrome c-type biogenesis protein CcmF
MLPQTLTPGTTLIVVAAFTSGLAAILLGYSYLFRTDDLRRPIVGAAAVTAGSLVTALVYLTYQFVVGDYTNAYVWQNSAEYLPLLYKITGVYANHAGSILLWATITSVVATWTVFSSYFDGRGSRLVQSLSLGIVAVFATMLSLESPFTPLSVAYPDISAGFVPPDGNGLNPLLVDPWMAIHPPITFSAYSLLVVPFALGVTHFVASLRGEESPFDDWLPSVISWARISWLLLTMAILFGAIWAYGVLGWGGFWSWDPVETAVLVPWLGLTASLHALNRYDTTGDYPLFAPTSLAGIFPLIVFATTVVRSGVFRSVHSFAAGGIGAGVLGLLGVTGTAAVVLPFSVWFRRAGGETETTSTDWLSRRTIYHWVVLAFVFLTFVAAWGLLFPVLRNAATGVEVSVGKDHYNLWSYPIIVVTLLAGGLYAVLDTGRRTLAAGATAAVAAVTVAAAFYAPTGSWHLSDPVATDPLIYQVIGELSVLSIVPPAAFFAAAWTGRYVSRVRGVPSRAFKIRETGVVLIHVGAAVLIVAISFVYLFATASTVGVVGIADATEDEPVVGTSTDGEYTVEVSGCAAGASPTLEEETGTPAELQRVDVEATFVRGTITELGAVENVSVARLDDSGVWLASPDGDADFEVGTEVIARGTVFESAGGNSAGDLYVYTDGQNIGPLSDPPREAYTPRVQSHELDVTIYNGDSVVAEGVLAEQSYADSQMNTNDALITRGLTGDTYAVGTINEVGASITINRYPLANQIWIGVLTGLVGMVLLLVGDRRLRQ